MGRARARRAYLTGVAVVLLVAVLGSFAWARAHRPDGDRASSLYCAGLTHPADAVGVVRHAVEGHPETPSLRLADLRSMAGVLYSDDVAAGAPSAYRPDAERLVRALRQAIATGSVAPLDRPSVLRSMRRLQAHAGELCPST